MNRIQRWMADRRLRKALRSNRHGWVLTQRGNEYDIEPIQREEDTGMYLTADSDEYIEDHAGMMHTLEGVPFGLRRDDSIYSSESAVTYMPVSSSRWIGSMSYSLPRWVSTHPWRFDRSAFRKRRSAIHRWMRFIRTAP